MPKFSVKSVRLWPVLFCAFALIAARPEARAEADRALAALPEAEETAERALPRVLSDADADRYRELFSLQKKGSWRRADALIKTLEDDVLLGHLKAQRYLHPTKYRSHYKELKAWMASFADHPQARRIYRLAVKRRPKNWKWPDRPLPVGSGPNVQRVRDLSDKPLPRRGGLSAEQRKRAGSLKAQLRNRLRHGWTKSAKRLLRTEEVQTLLSAAEFDYYRARLGLGYFTDGRDRWAYDWASKAAERSGDRVPTAHWVAGLAAWRLGEIDTSGDHFGATARSPYADADTRAAAAFWAARAALVGGRPEEVVGWLQEAEDRPRTFYGLLAHRLLGHELPFHWRGDAADNRALLRMADSPGGLRLLALMQAGQPDLAERELILLASRGDGDDAYRIALAFADRAGLAEASLRLARLLYGSDAPVTFAFPVPALDPKDGFSVDRALLYALMRQESAFNADARSHMGARGLLQIMPRTASFVAGDRKLHGKKRKTLHDPDVNLKLGQMYIRHLLREPAVEGDLLRLITAWNGGPGNLAKWLRRNRHKDDPLLFIESIPLRETRGFAKQVLTNLWIYRDRLGQHLPSLTSIAAGTWPAYTPLDGTSTVVAENVEDRR